MEGMFQKKVSNKSATQNLKGSLYEEKIVELIKSKIKIWKIFTFLTLIGMKLMRFKIS